MALNCIFDDIVQKLYSKTFYTCQVKDQEVPEFLLKIKGIHKKGKGNDDVIKVTFIECVVPIFPQVIGETFKNIQILIMRKAGLKSITKLDLKLFEHLIHLDLSENELGYLPGDLFEFNKKLKQIYFCENKLQFIGPELLDNHLDLERAYFKNNPKIKYVFNGSYESASYNHLKKLIEIIKRDCKPPIKFLKAKKKITEEFKVEEATTSAQKIVNNFSIEDFSDFSIIVENREFKVHKFIMAGRSDTLAEYFKENPGVEKLDLQEISDLDITAEVFNSILKAIYTNKLQKSRDALKVFEAACFLKTNLDFTTSLISSVKNEENLKVLFKIIKMACQFNKNWLKLVTFEEIKRHFKGKILPNDLAEQPDVLEEFINAKLKLDELKNM